MYIGGTPVIARDIVRTKTLAMECDDRWSSRMDSFVWDERPGRGMKI